jgi:hypothetical protein
VNKARTITNIHSRLLLIVAGIIIAVSLGCASSGSGYSDDAPARPAPSLVNFITFGGIEYLAVRIERTSQLQEDDLGSEFGRVAFKYDGNVFDYDYKSQYGKDGDAALLEVGTPIYAVKGYKPEFLLAARTDGELVLYLSDSHPNAVIGSDVMDLEDKVVYIGVNSSKDGTTELGAIKDQSKVDELVQMVLKSRVDQESSGGPNMDIYFLAFHMKDGITVTKSYGLQTNKMSRGVYLPNEFRAAVEDALP